MFGYVTTNMEEMINCTYSVGSILTHNCEAAEQLRVIYILNHFIL